MPRNVTLPAVRNAAGNARLTAISASFVLPLFLFEVATVVLGVRSVITLHVAVGLVLIGPLVVKLASVTYRMVGYYRGLGDYRRRGKPSDALRLLGSALALLIVLLLVSGLVLIAGPNGLRSTARSIHVVTAYLTVTLLIVHVVIHFLPAMRQASADARRHAPDVSGAHTRWLAVSASFVLGGLLAVLLGGRGATYLHHHHPASKTSSRPSLRQRGTASMSAQTVLASPPKAIANAIGRCSSSSRSRSVMPLQTSAASSAAPGAHASSRLALALEAPRSSVIITTLASPARQASGHWLLARYGGRCDSCRETIAPGDRIRHSPGRNVCERCGIEGSV
jgi:hypothetical protein